VIRSGTTHSFLGRTPEFVDFRRAGSGDPPHNTLDWWLSAASITY
jgi:hypothetical protein